MGTDRNGRNGGADLWALLWLALFAGVPAAVALHDSPGSPARPAFVPPALSRPATPPPRVEPMAIRPVDRDSARAINAAVPFVLGATPPARPFAFAGAPADRDRAIDCLAAAEYYEAGDDATGERAVAQVVINRLRHPAFPKTVCGVVFQGSERSTGCQFTFTCDGALLARTPPDAAWDRARSVARAALSGSVDRKVGYATHYHTDWVVPYWSATLDKIAAVGTHLFYRWTGWWGTAPAFRRTVSSQEPAIAAIARLSRAHAAALSATPAPAAAMRAAAAMAAAPALAINVESFGKRIGGARLVAADPALTSFIVTLDPGAAPDSYPAAARALCAGRQRCRILAWIEGSQAPQGFPISGDQLSAMRFSYIHDAVSGLQRILWNCAQSPRASATQCMRRRDPVDAPAAASPSPTAASPPSASLPPLLEGVRRKRYEQVTVTPPPALLSPDSKTTKP